MSKKIEELVEQMATEENKWRDHVKKHIKHHPKGDLGKMNDDETKEFFKKVKSSYGKGHSDEEIKAMHNGGEKEEKEKDEKKESVHKHWQKFFKDMKNMRDLGIALMIYEQILNLRNRSELKYQSEIAHLREDLIRLGFTEEMCKVQLKNMVFLGEIEDPSKIKVENPGVLEVPEGKDVEKLPYSHFKNLAKKKGREKVVRALMNLYRWNKGKGGDKGSLANWAKKTQEKLSAEFEKEE